MTAIRFTRAEERIINRIQEDIPLAVEPFRLIADELSIEESELLETVARLKEKRIVRNISAIFNAHRLGYHSSLVAMSVDEGDVEGAVEIINAHPGVSHNYLRDHRFNIWFTLAVDAATSLEETAAVLARHCRATDHLILRNEKLYKIGFMLRMGDDAPEDGEEDEAAGPNGAALAHDDGGYALSGEERDAVLLLQTDLPITPRPFDAIVSTTKSSMSSERLVTIGEALKQKGNHAPVRGGAQALQRRLRRERHDRLEDGSRARRRRGDCRYSCRQRASRICTGGRCIPGDGSTRSSR
ncbi:MAG: hypothetical protein AB2L13_13485 [Spirochaetota bacterium]